MRMNGKKHIKNLILMLIGVLMISVVTQFVPHHHHEGKICVETSESLSHAPGSHDDCQLESSDVEYAGTCKVNFKITPQPLYFTLLYSLYFLRDPDSPSIYRSDSPKLTFTPYAVKPNKHRGSPLFSWIAKRRNDASVSPWPWFRSCIIMMHKHLFMKRCLKNL